MAVNINGILAHFSRTTDQFLSQDEFRAKLRSGKQLRVKYGVDVRSPMLHLGHAVNLWLLRYLQDLGHKVIFVIADYTARLGDHDGRLETLSGFSEEEVKRNIREFIDQARMVLRVDDPRFIEIRRDSEWYGQMSIHDLMDVFSLVTHARLVARDQFQMRIEEGKEIYVHELLYPILQGYDSLMVESDLSIIGSDQLFNESIGRLLQEKHKKKPQTLITTKITAGTDGRQKQSRSLGNYIGLAHSPRDKFGRVMSIPDTLIEEYFRVYTDTPLEEIDAMKGLIGEKPRDAKIALARAIVARYHGAESAGAEYEWFENTISKGLIPDDLPTLAIVSPRMEALDLVTLARPGKSKGDTRRLLRQGGVELDGKKLNNPEMELLLRTGDILKVGKRNWFRIEVVKLNELETEKLWLKPMQTGDINAISSFLPESEFAQYLSKRGSTKRVRAPMMKDAFRKVILQAEPRNDWLWKIIQKERPEAIAGVAHLRRDAQKGNQNVWLDPDLEDKEAILSEILTAVNTHAFDVLGFSSIEFKTAFALATAPPNLMDLHRLLTNMKTEQLNKDNPDGSWGFTKEGWQMMQEWRRRTSPGLFKNPAEPPRPEAAMPRKPSRKKKPQPGEDPGGPQIPGGGKSK
jgi:tyrosyl-tRNA synthetase